MSNKRVILCLGSGGVGKTTVAASLALALADDTAGSGERVVVLTIDPARRLADSLGLRTVAPGRNPRRESEISNEVQVVPGTDEQVFATMLDPVATFESVVREETDTDDQAERILRNPLFQNLTRSLSGTNEYMAAERLHQLYHDPRFDRIVVDTPPSRHALDFLDSPQRLSRFINHRLYRSVFAPRSGLARTVSAGGQMMLKLLGRLVGGRLVDDVIGFFAAFEGLDEGFDRRAKEIDRILTTDSSITLVTSARREPLDEARWIAANVARRFDRPDPIDTLVVNRLLPIDPKQAAAATKDSTDDGRDPLAVNLAQLGQLATKEHDLVEDFRAELGRAADGVGPSVVKLAEQVKPVSNLEGLRELAQTLRSQLSD